jgi:hypothetical protein
VDYVEASLPENKNLDAKAFGFKTTTTPVPSATATGENNCRLTLTAPVAGDDDYVSVYIISPKI